MITLLAKLPIWLLLALSAAGVVSGDYFAKSWSLNQRGWVYGLAIAGYAVSALFYIPTLLREGLVITSVIWVVLSTIGFLVVGILIFHETLTPLQWVGVGLGIASLLILTIAH
jgi:multidrug transporter EmrE-like cation transporter